jgi:guanosine-3',5'-bis(diphosphate) 3'-pyrophosphohydrolase
MSLILEAAQFARKAHRGQVRKYTGVEYISHPARVAGRVAVHIDATEEMVAAAFLHDTIEDTGVTIQGLEDRFGEIVTNMVIDLTDPTCPAIGPTFKDVPRAQRKTIMRHSIAAGENESKIIKMYDRIDNLREMPMDPPNSYIRMYLEESRLLAEAIGSVDLALKEELLELCRLTSA